MNEPRTLLHLYKLLWEQIKDEDVIISIRFHIRILRGKNLISIQEMVQLDNHLFCNKPENETSKQFTQRMIKELSDGDN